MNRSSRRPYVSCYVESREEGMGLEQDTFKSSWEIGTLYL